MKGFLLALFCIFLLSLTGPLALRLYKGEKFFKPLLFTFSLILVFYILLDSFLFPKHSPDFFNGFLLLILFFPILLDFIYGSFLTGFSSEILIKILSQKESGVTFEELFQSYGGHLKIDQVLEKKLQNLEKGDYLLKKEEAYQLKPKGSFVVKMTYAVQKLLFIKETG